MNLLSMDILIVYIFLTITLLIGIYFGRGIKTVKEYALANKRYTTTILVLTLVATELGGGATTGAANEIFYFGLMATLPFLGIAIGSIIFARYICNKFDNRFTEALSVCDLIKYFYGTKAEKFTALLAFIVGAGEIGVQFTALGYLCSSLFAISYTTAIVITCSIIIIYSSFGGIKSVTITDVVQFCVLIVFVPTIAIILVNKAGSIDVIINHYYEVVDLENNKNYLYVALFFMYVSPFYFFYPPIVQRILMVKETEKIAEIFYINSGIRFLYTIVIALIALSVFYLIPNSTGNNTITEALNFLPTGIQGLAICGLLAVIMSTADSNLNTISIIFIHNFFKKKESTDSQELLKIKIVSLFLGIAAMLFALAQLNLLKLIASTAGVWAAVVGVPALMGILHREVNEKKFWVCATFSIASFIICTLLNIEVLNNLAPCIALAMGLIGYFISSTQKVLIAKNAQNNVLSSFNDLYNRWHVNPNIFAYFCITIYIIPYLIWSNSGLMDYDSTIILRIIAGLLCIGLLFSSSWTEKYQKFFSVYWYITVIFCIPFLMTIMLVLGVAEQFWILNMALGIVLIFSLTDWFSSIVILFVGMILGFLYCQLFLGRYFFIDNPNALILTFYACIFAIFIGFLFIRPRENKIIEKFALLQAFGGTMAHEVKTPLSSNQTSLSLMESIIDEEAQIKEKTDKVSIELHKDSYKAIRYAMGLMKKSNKQGQQTVDMLLMSMKKGGELQGRKDHLSLKICIDEALEEYGFQHSQREHIKVNIKNDIKFVGDKEHIKHVIFNLVKNAFKHGGSDINIDIIVQGNILTFKDNGMGIPANKLPKIFDDFYTGSNTGTGLGLSLCRKVMESIGGVIKCKSKQGEYTEFTLEIPPL